MRKIALAIVFVLITIVGINTYNKDSEKEVSQIILRIGVQDD